MSDSRAEVNPETLDVSRTVLVTASRPVVWLALTDPVKLEQWFGQRAEIHELAVGGTGFLGWDSEGDFPIEIVEVLEPVLFSFRWGYEPLVPITKANSTIVRFSLADSDVGTAIELVESGFDKLQGDESLRRQRAEGNREGWDEELDELVAWLEATN